MKTAELTGAALDWAVAKAIGEYKPVAVPAYSTDWAQGGPIIERERIDLVWNGDWFAETDAANRSDWVATGRGRTPLIAAMRCYCESKLGDDVDVPKELA